MAHAEYRPVFGAGLDGGLGLFLGQGQGFFAENMFPRRHGALDLLGVKRMRRGKDNGLHAGVLEGFRVAAVVRKAVSLGKFLSCWMFTADAQAIGVSTLTGTFAPWPSMVVSVQRTQRPCATPPSLATASQDSLRS
jgi:hypothetical protein